MTIQKANVDILLQAQAYSSPIHRPNQPRVDEDHTQHTRTKSHDNPKQQTAQHPLLLSMLNFKLPHTLNTHDVTFQIPKGIILFARNLHLHSAGRDTHPGHPKISLPKNNPSICLPKHSKPPPSTFVTPRLPSPFELNIS